MFTGSLTKMFYCGWSARCQRRFILYREFSFEIFLWFSDGFFLYLKYGIVAGFILAESPI